MVRVLANKLNLGKIVVYLAFSTFQREEFAKNGGKNFKAINLKRVGAANHFDRFQGRLLFRLSM